MPRTVFVSYAREDETRAREVYKRLLNSGYKPWMDKEDLVPGEAWDPAIKRAVRNSDFLVLCLSAKSVAKRGYLQREFKLALDLSQEMLSTDIYLIPVRLDQCQPPDELSHLQWVDIFRPDGWNRLLAALETGAKQRGLRTSGESREHGVTESGHAPPPPAPATDQLAAGSGQQRLSDPVDAGHIGVLVPALPDNITQRGWWLSTLAHMSPWLLFTVGLVLLITGNVLTVATGSDALLERVFDSRGFGGLRLVTGLLHPFALVLIGVGFFLLLGWLLHLTYLRPRTPVMVAVPIVVSLLVVAAGAVNITVRFRPGPGLLRFAQGKAARDVGAWIDQVLALQTEGGGIRSGGEVDAPVQVWTTSQVIVGALAGVRAGLTPNADYGTVWETVGTALEYVERSRVSRDGGGWAYWAHESGDSEPPVTEVNAWATLAMASAAMGPSNPALSPQQSHRLETRVAREIDALIGRQAADGGWSPIASARRDTRTYSTLMAVWALMDAAEVVGAEKAREANRAAANGLQWLMSTGDSIWGWIPNPVRRDRAESYPGLTAQTLFVLTRASRQDAFRFLRNTVRLDQARAGFVNDFAFRNQPLNYFDKRIPDYDQHIPGAGFIIEASTFLWFPWALAVLDQMADDSRLSRAARSAAARYQTRMMLRWDDLKDLIGRSPPYIAAETLFCASVALGS
jgi:hypothetical protein